MLRTILAISAALSLPALGCATEAALSDGAEDSFLLQGKLDGIQIREGSEEAIAVLAVVNESSLEELDDEVGLDSRAARNIVSYRDGGRLIQSLAVLDDISYVGPVALQLLLDYAYSQGDLEAEQADDDAVLRLANSASMALLDDSAEVGLDRRAARAIVTHRDGADRLPGTADDQHFDSIEQLDAMPYVGVRALSALRAYAGSHEEYARAPWKQGWHVNISNRYVARFEGDLMPNSISKEKWQCHLLIEESQIFCATWAPEIFGTVTNIEEDGSFSSGTANRAHLSGRVHPNRQVTIDSVRTVDSNGEGDKRLSPMDSYIAKTLCWQPQVNFPSGGSVAGFWNTCDQLY